MVWQGRFGLTARDGMRRGVASLMIVGLQDRSPSPLPDARLERANGYPEFLPVVTAPSLFKSWAVCCPCRNTRKERWRNKREQPLRRASFSSFEFQLLQMFD